MEDFLFWFLVFFPALYFGIIYLFKKTKNEVIEQILIIYFAAINLFITVTLIKYSLNTAENWYIVLAILNSFCMIYNSIIVFKKMTKESVWDYTRYSLNSILISVIICGLLFIILEFILHVYWAVTLSVILIYLSTIQHYVGKIFSNDRL
ncbi:MAG: hypothetical protein ACP5N1_02320 [Candidatus Woesearchaeota archaeon]